MKSILLIILGLISSVKGFCQENNLSFENGLKGWLFNGDGQNITCLIDSCRVLHGRNALHIKQKKEADLAIGTFVNLLQQKGVLKISYAFFCNDKKVRYPEIFLQTTEKDIRRNAMKTTSCGNDWYRNTMQIEVENLNSVAIGVIYKDAGEIWLDDFHITLNDIPLDHLKRSIYHKLTEDKAFDSGSSGVQQVDLSKENLKRLYFTAKIWGLLKYYHPNIAKGDFNWDYELFRILPDVLNPENDFKKVILRWVDKVGTVSPIAENNQRLNNTLFKWITPKNLGGELYDRLCAIITASNHESNYYMSMNILCPLFNNENPYLSFNVEDCGYRLLSLFRTWNIIEYFFPYKHLTEKKWDLVLKEYIPLYLSVNNDIDYGKVIMRFAAEIGDSHTNVIGGIINEIYNDLGLSTNKTTSVFLRSIENKCVVTDLVKGRNTILQVGDVITHVNNKPIDQIIKKYRPFYAYSNQELIDNRIMHLILTNIKQDSVKLRWIRGTKKFNQYIHTVKKTPYYPEPNIPFKEIDKNISYIDVGYFDENKLDSLMICYKDKSGIIIDLRTYPRSFMIYKMGDYLMPSTQKFVQFRQTTVQTPGIYDSLTFGEIGKNNSDYYKGKIVLIVNNGTMSSGEFTTMGWSVAPNAMVIGSQTAGADGNVTSFLVPGGYKISFSGLGVYYPDGGQTQRVGVRIDEIVKPTIKGIREGRDEVLERAIEIINSEMSK